MAGGIDGIGRHARFRFLWATVRVRVPHSALDNNNPKPVPIGNGFGFLVYLFSHVFPSLFLLYQSHVVSGTIRPVFQWEEIASQIAEQSRHFFQWAKKLQSNIRQWAKKIIKQTKNKESCHEQTNSIYSDVFRWIYC